MKYIMIICRLFVDEAVTRSNFNMFVVGIVTQMNTAGLNVHVMEIHFQIPRDLKHLMTQDSSSTIPICWWPDNGKLFRSIPWKCNTFLSFLFVSQAIFHVMLDLHQCFVRFITFNPSPKACSVRAAAEGIKLPGVPQSHEVISIKFSGNAYHHRI